MVEMIPVESSNVAAVGYHEDVKDIHVQFKNGSTYKYGNVPKEVYEQLVGAASVGGFLNSQIKPNYSCERIK